MFKIANHLNRAVENIGRKPLKVLVQVNTSGEECECEMYLAVLNFIVLFGHYLSHPTPALYMETRCILICLLAAKFGIDPSGCVELVKHVSTACPNLEFCGLMTIGMLDYTSTPENFKVVILHIF